jgi:Collagen triple helix repeat (20 copies)
MRFVRRLRSLRPRGLGAVTVAVIVGALIGLAGAAAKLTSGGTVHACVTKTSGSVRFVSLNHRCQKGESSLLLGQKGQRGKPGKAGKVGATGPIGLIGLRGPAGPTGPSGPADTEVVDGPVETLSGGEPTGATVISTAGCDQAVNGANREAYGGGLNVVTHPQTQQADIVSVQASYAGNGATGTTLATQPGSGQRGNAWTGVAVINRLYADTTPPDTATVQAYVVCGP